MNTYETKSLAVGRRQAKALERIADAIIESGAFARMLSEQEKVPVEEIELAGVITWQDAVHVMRTTCIEADECGPGCPMNAWCQTFNKEGSAPAKWEPIENDEEAEK